MRAIAAECSRPSYRFVAGQVDKKRQTSNGNGVGIGAGAGAGGGIGGGEGEDSAGDGLASNVSRQPSLRQQEKAPEGRAPHAQNVDDSTAVGTTVDRNADVSHDDWDEEGEAPPAESRFTEGV